MHRDADSWGVTHPLAPSLSHPPPPLQYTLVHVLCHVGTQGNTCANARRPAVHHYTFRGSGASAAAPCGPCGHRGAAGPTTAQPPIAAFGCGGQEPAGEHACCRGRGGPLVCGTCTVGICRAGGCHVVLHAQ
eukprot:1161904-Pelagomonas_calceolata.AAC.1